MDPATLLPKLTARQDLDANEARALFEAVMEGRVEPVLIAALLAALATKGESLTEIVAAARTMRARATPVRTPPGVTVIDTCGTGGDGQPTFNVSSAAAIVAAAAGATVAKHGNRSNARPSGSAEGLSALGINIAADVPVVERCLRESRIAFLYAPQLHPAMKHAAPVRRTLGIRTIFNLVGPLTNPAGVKRQFLGVNRAELIPTMIAALRELGAERALVVHGREGLCDISPAGTTLVGRWDGQTAAVEEIDCRAIGLQPARLEDVFVASPRQSAEMIRHVLTGRPGAARNMVVLNAAGALWVAGLAADWRQGAALASAAIDSGAALDVLHRWCAVSNATG